MGSVKRPTGHLFTSESIPPRCALSSWRWTRIAKRSWTDVPRAVLKLLAGTRASSQKRPLQLLLPLWNLKLYLFVFKALSQENKLGKKRLGTKKKKKKWGKKKKKKKKKKK